MSTRAEIQNQINNVDRNIWATNEQIRILQEHLANVEKARTELSQIRSWATEDAMGLNRLDCENPQFWKGSCQNKCATDYNNCTPPVVAYSNRLDAWGSELITTRNRFDAELRSQQSSLAALTSNRQHLVNLLSQLN